MVGFDAAELTLRDSKGMRFLAQLRAAVRTGAFCRYEPVPGQGLRWLVRT